MKAACSYRVEVLYVIKRIICKRSYKRSTCALNRLILHLSTVGCTWYSIILCKLSVFAPWLRCCFEVSPLQLCRLLHHLRAAVVTTSYNTRLRYGGLASMTLGWLVHGGDLLSLPDFLRLLLLER